jgi:hypothetical protein
MLFTKRQRAKRTMATSTPLLRAAARGVEARNWHGEDGGRNKTTTGTETETDNHNHTTNTAAAAVHDEGDDKHGTRTEGAGDGYNAVRRGTQKGAQETSSTSLRP